MSFVSASTKGTYDHTVVNDELEEAYEKLKGILIQVCMRASHVTYGGGDVGPVGLSVYLMISVTLFLKKNAFKQKFIQQIFGWKTWWLFYIKKCWNMLCPIRTHDVSMTSTLISHGAHTKSARW